MSTAAQQTDVTPAAPAPAPKASSKAAPAPARPMLCIALLTLMGFALGCSEFVPIGIQPELAEAFGVELARTGELISLYSITYAVLTPVLAVAGGRFRRYTLLLVYAALFCLGNIAMAVAPTFELLLAARMLLGAVSGVLLAVGVTYVPELVGLERSSMAISVIYAAFSIAMVVATSLGRLAAAFLSWHVAMYGAVVFAVIVSIALVAVLPRTGETDEPARARDALELFTEPQILTGMCIFIFGVGSVYVFYGYITPYLEGVLGMDSVAASTVLMAYGVACFFSNLLSGWIDARFGIRALVVTFPVQALLLAGLFLVGANTLPALGLIIAIGLSMYFVSVPCVSLFMSTARRRHPKALTLASSLEPMAFNTGIAFGTAVGGWVVSGIGIAWAGAVGAVFSLAACLLAAVTHALARRKR